MAEAVVEERPQQKFYCHICDIQFQNAENFKCPNCSDGFIEELQDAPEANDDDVGIEIIWEEDDNDDMMMTTLPAMDQRGSRLRRPAGGRRTLTRLASSNLRQNVPFENLIQDFIINLGVGMNWGNAGNMQLFLGNPGDYAWGREGLDAIVTQLLNQMDGTGPPPVPKDVIDSLPIVQVTEEQVNAKLQCSVCWEDFQIRESVRQLPCLHVYHEPCIRPWLELHGTCPICRQNLVNNENSSSDGNPDSGGAAFTEEYIRQRFQPNDSSPSSSNSSSSINNSGSRRSRSYSDSMM